jgi:hypothetical protein
LKTLRKNRKWSKMSRLSPAKTKPGNRYNDREKRSPSRQPATDFYAGIHTLQRNAGNRAVTGWLQPRMDQFECHG